MRSNASPRMNVVKKEDKEAMIRDFIVQDLAARASAPAPASACYLLMALSADSPVARALASLANELAGAHITVQAVFARSGPQVKTEAATGLERVATLRHAPDVRLLDAHEQLVLGPSKVWVGDCMRRDPAKRDAYECFAEDSSETAVWAKRSFDRVWQRARPIRATTMNPGLAHSLDLNAATAEALAVLGENAPAAGATRH